MFKKYEKFTHQQKIQAFIEILEKRKISAHVHVTQWREDEDPEVCVVCGMGQFALQDRVQKIMEGIGLEPNTCGDATKDEKTKVYKTGHGVHTISDFFDSLLKMYK